MSVSLTVDEVEVLAKDVNHYVEKGFKSLRVKTRNYWGKPPLFVLRRVIEG